MAGRRKTVYRSPRVIVEFDLDAYRSGMRRCALGPELRSSVDRVAARGESFAKRIAPRTSRQHQHYADSFRIERTTVTLPKKRYPMRRVCARLWNLAPHAASVEWGNAQTNGNGHRILGRTLENLQHLSPR